MEVEHDFEQEISCGLNEKGDATICVRTDVCFDNFWSRIKHAWITLMNKCISLDTECLVEDESVKTFIRAFLKEDEDKVFNVVKTLPEAILPTKAHNTDAGWDLYLPQDELVLNPGEVKRVNFGIVVEIKPGYAIYVMNRSGVVWKYSTMMCLGTGLVDQDYRGEIKAPFYNFGHEQIRFKRGDRMAQMVIKRTEDIKLVEGNVNIETERGDGGFGSSGK